MDRDEGVQSHAAFKNSQRQEGTGRFSNLNLERRDWEAKIVKIGGEWKYVNFVFYNTCIAKGGNCLA